MDNDKYKFNVITLEHYKQICRFQKESYSPGDYQRYIKQQKYNQFKIWHKKEMDKKDALTRLNCKNL